jgi:predicted transcriptional regulator of viral defense system
MRFREFEATIKELHAFNLNDARKIDPDFHRQQLTYWHNQRYIKPLTGGYYALWDKPIDEKYLFLVANKVYEPSYVSMESALAYYEVIPETVLGVTSISSRKTKQYKSNWGVFSYRSVKPHCMIGYQVIEYSPGCKFKIASLEKAITDYLYLNSDIHSLADFEELRWNQAQLHRLLDRSMFSKYVTIYDKRALESRVDTFEEFLNA